MRPDVQALLDRAVAAHRQEQLAEAEARYREVLDLDPESTDALHLLGVLLGQTGRTVEGSASIARAIALRPDEARFHCNAGKLMTDEGRVDEAIAACRTALALKPGYVEALVNLGAALNAAGRHEEAVEVCREAVGARPDMAAALNNLGTAQRGLGQADDAIASYRSAIAMAPRLASARHNLGNVLKEVGRVAEALAVYREALAVAPSFIEAHHHLVNTLHYDPACDAETLCREARRWKEAHVAHIAPSVRHGNDASPDRRLQVGYVSADFRAHPVGLNLLPLFEAHDRTTVRVTCYAGVSRPDALTARFRRLADRWVDAVSLQDDALADVIRSDRIDILVDLSLHSGGNRLPVFARRPAPVQVTFAGYPGTTGLDAIGYRLTDPYLDPPDVATPPYAEESVRLGSTFWCYDPLSEEPVAPPPAITRGFVTFGCLNNFCKVNEGVLRMWSAALRAVPSSRLLLLAPRGQHRAATLDLLAREQVAADRVTFVEHQPRSDYLRTYHRIDIGLDTVPYNGHTTSLDAFWMGVPVLTRVGRTIVGRAGLSQSLNLGLPQLVTDSDEAFAARAASLAGDLEHLAALRLTLRERMKASPLNDGPRFAREVERAFRWMWREWCAHQR